jgi:hypothetical protein
MMTSRQAIKGRVNALVVAFESLRVFRHSVKKREQSKEQRAESREHFAARILRISILLKKLIISENNPKRTTLCVLAFWTR